MGCCAECANCNTMRCLHMRCHAAYGGPVGGAGPGSAAEACDALLQECLARGAKDNLVSSKCNIRAYNRGLA